MKPLPLLPFVRHAGARRGESGSGWVLILLLLVILPFALCRADTADDEVLTRASSVRSLSRARAAEHRPVHFRGVVTWLGLLGTMTVEQDGVGIWVNIDASRKAGVWKGDDAVMPKLARGTVVEIFGQSQPGGYAPVVFPERIVVEGKAGPLPQAPVMDPGRFFSGADDCQRVIVRGVVQAYKHTGAQLSFLVDANPGQFTMDIPERVVTDPERLVDAEVKLTGVAATLFNTRSELTGIRLLVDRFEDIEIEKPPPALGQVPLVEIGRLSPFRATPTKAHRVRIEGLVTHVAKGKSFFLQEGTNVVRVETTSTEPITAGDRVEVAGFVRLSRFIGTLFNSVYRINGRGPLPAAEEIPPERIVELNNVAIRGGLAARPHDYDGHLIQFRAALLGMQTAEEGLELPRLTLDRLLPNGHHLIFGALLPDGNASSFSPLKAGSEVEVTGLVQLDYPAGAFPSLMSRELPVGITVILRSPDDIVVVRQPPWWNSQRLVVLVAVMGLALGVAAFWNRQLKRQVERKAGQLAAERDARREAEIELNTTMRERNRLAANLHDTLPQTLNGIAWQIDACEMSLRQRGVDRLPALDVARRMLNYGMRELRSAVWEMRSLSLCGRSFGVALQSVVDKFSEENQGRAVAVKVSLQLPDEHLHESTASQSLLIIREAMRNAVQHGNARSIAIHVSAAGPCSLLTVSIVDDGTGFEVDRRHGPAQGHYGLTVMKERAEKLGGSFSVESQPGSGTTIRFQLPQKSPEPAPENPLAGRKSYGRAS